MAQMTNFVSSMRSGDKMRQMSPLRFKKGEKQVKLLDINNLKTLHRRIWHGFCSIQTGKEGRKEVGETYRKQS